MAKGLRASRNKKNNQALSKRVFAPVEAARNERLSAKLLELARQPKAPKEEMEIEQGEQSCHDRIKENISNISFTDSSDKKSGAAAEGTPSLSISIPKTVASTVNNHQLPTPPSTPPDDGTASVSPILDEAGQQLVAREQLFYHLLGASSDIVGFDEDGDLRLAFDMSTPPQNT